MRAAAGVASRQQTDALDVVPKWSRRVVVASATDGLAKGFSRSKELRRGRCEQTPRSTVAPVERSYVPEASPSCFTTTCHVPHVAAVAPSLVLRLAFAEFVRALVESKRGVCKRNGLARRGACRGRAQVLFGQVRAPGVRCSAVTPYHSPVTSGRLLLAARSSPPIIGCVLPLVLLVLLLLLLAADY